MAEPQRPAESSINTLMQTTTDDKKSINNVGDLVQNLPQELYDIILEYTLKLLVPNKPIVRITRNYRPPVALQINHSLRKRIASAYYRKTTFKLAHEDPWTCAISDGLLVTWAQSLPRSHLQRIKSIKCKFLRTGPVTCQYDVNILEREMCDYRQGLAGCLKLRYGDIMNCIKINVLKKNAEGKEKVIWVPLLEDHRLVEYIQR